MKIYFSGSVRGGRNDVEAYFEIINHLKNFGEVLTEHIGDKKNTSDGEDLSDEIIHNRDFSWLLSSDVVVAEVSNPSLGVGYEIRGAVERKKPVLCLWRSKEGKKLSPMIAGCSNISVRNYNSLGEAKLAIDDFFKSLSNPSC